MSAPTAPDRILRNEKQDYTVDDGKIGIFKWADGILRRNGSISVKGLDLTFVMTGKDGCYLDDVMAVLRDLYRYYLTGKIPSTTFGKIFGTTDYVCLSDDKYPLLFTSGNIINFRMDDCCIGDILFAIRNTYLTYKNPDKFTLSVIAKLEVALSWCNMGCVLEADSDESRRFVSKIIDVLQKCVEEMDFRSYDKHKFSDDKEEEAYVPEYMKKWPCGPK